MAVQRTRPRGLAIGVSLAIFNRAHDLLTIEANGDYAGAKKILDELGVLRPGWSGRWRG